MSTEAVVAYFIAVYNQSWSRDSVVGIATRYGLDVPGIESKWGRDFLHLSRRALGPTQPPVQWIPGLLGVKRHRCGTDHPPPPSAELKERAELYLYSPSGPSWPVLGWPLPLYEQLFGVTQENHKHFGDDSRCPGWDSNRVRPACESKPTYSVATKNCNLNPKKSIKQNIPHCIFYLYHFKTWHWRAKEQIRKEIKRVI
jgi:hypothetical protein